ncbi:ribose-phosphate pyrophosphokinase [Candidatus Vidania fulgoroideae]|nr:ribose-phosphate pyrophosphokinase [Candidatus Vidania fulgoroideae]
MLIFYKNLETLCKKVANKLSTKPYEIKIKKYHNGEYIINFKKNLINKKVTLFFNLCKPININIIKCNFIIHFLKQAQAKTITLISPYLGYCRQDRPNDSNNLIAAKLLAKLLESAGLNKIITVDIHSEQIAGFYNIPLINLKTTKIIQKLIKTTHAKIIFPDNGSSKRFRALNKTAPYIFSKLRNKTHITLSKTTPIPHSKVIIIDDIIDTGTTLKATLTQLKSKCIYVYVSHITNYNAQVIKHTKIKKIFTTNSIQNNNLYKKITQIDLSTILLQKIQHDTSIY